MGYRLYQGWEMLSYFISPHCSIFCSSIHISYVAKNFSDIRHLNACIAYKKTIVFLCHGGSN